MEMRKHSEKFPVCFTVLMLLLSVCATGVLGSPARAVSPSNDNTTREGFQPTTDALVSTNGTNSSQGNETVAAKKDNYLNDLKRTITLIVTPIVCAFGILGNILNLVVLSQKRMHSSTNSFLIALAISDMLLLLMQVGPTAVNTLNFKGQSPTYIIASRYLQIIRYVVSNIFITCTSWLTMAVTIERFITIRFALRGRLICTIQRAKVAITTIFIVSFVFHFSKWFEFAPNQDYTNQIPYTQLPLSKNKIYNGLMHTTNIAVAVFIPEVSLLILNTLLIYFLVKHQQKIKHIKEQNSKEVVHITIVVITMVLVFMICHSIGLYLAISITIYSRASVLRTPTGTKLRYINNLLVLLNSSVNFILYAAINQRFQKTFKEIFFRCSTNMPQKKNSVSSSKTKFTSSEHSQSYKNSEETQI